MKIDFTTPILNLEGEPELEKSTFDEQGKEVKGKIITLETVSINALMTMIQGDKQQTGVEKLALYSLALGVKNGKEEITVEEATLLKERIGRMYSPLYVGRAYELIEE